MITEGIIQDIDYTSNTCTVRIPLYETVQGLGKAVVTAHFSYQPGIYAGYETNDVVWVNFEQNRPHSPVIVGRILTADDARDKPPDGAFRPKSLYVQDKAELPIDTDINTQEVDYNSLQKLINNLKYLNAATQGKIEADIIGARYLTCLTIKDISTASTKQIYFYTSFDYSIQQDGIIKLLTKLAGMYDSFSFMPCWTTFNIIGLKCRAIISNSQNTFTLEGLRPDGGTITLYTPTNPNLQLEISAMNLTLI